MVAGSSKGASELCRDRAKPVSAPRKHLAHSCHHGRAAQEQRPAVSPVWTGMGWQSPGRPAPGTKQRGGAGGVQSRTGLHGAAGANDAGEKI